MEEAGHVLIPLTLLLEETALMMFLMFLVMYKMDNSVSRSQNLSIQVYNNSCDHYTCELNALTLHVADSGSCDRPIDPTNQNQYIVWGIGSLGVTAFQHHTRAAGRLR